jgi:uncharacterized membrane protein
MKPKKYRYNEQRAQQITPTEQKKTKLKKILIMLGIAMIAFAILKILLELGYLWAFIVFELLGGIPIIAYIIVVRGRMGKSPLPEELPDEWSEDEKQSFLATEKQRKEDGKIYLYIAFPFISAVLIAFITEFYIPMIFGG